MILSSRMRPMREELGVSGLLALALLAGALVFLIFVLRPLEVRNKQLDERLARSTRQDSASLPAATPAAALAAFYRFFETGKTTAESLAALHALGKAAGVEIQTAEYRIHKTGTRIGRYEIALPVTGSYTQIRAFLRSALAGIPALSLDRVSFRRAHVNEAQVHAEIRLTLHQLGP